MAIFPDGLYTAAQVRALDRCAIEVHNIPGITLMKRAGLFALDALLARWPQTTLITVFCGSGNNGGDGYIVAGAAAQRGLPVRVVCLGKVDKLTADGQRARAFAQAQGVAITPFVDGVALTEGVLVDALLGIGVAGEVRGPTGAAINAMNASGLPTLALDIPSGLCSDTGRELGVAVRAQVTTCFVGLKRGLYTGRGPAVCGDVEFSDLGVPEAVYNAAPASAVRLEPSHVLSALPQRQRDAHKGDFGHVLVIGGDDGYGGAVAMAAEAALRVGAGLVSVATRPQHVPALLARRPELMVHGVASGQELEPLLPGPTHLVIGPGLGRSPWSEQMLQQALNSGLPMVVDADALNILAAGRIGRSGVDARAWVLTPHPGEAARLLGVATAQVQQDRFSAAQNLWQRYPGTVLLKGAGTLLCHGEQAGGQPVFELCTQGNPGMASGGMGDVLSGVIGGLMAQGLTPADAARLGVCVHGGAADRAAAVGGERGLLATDLMAHLRRLVNG